MLSTLVITLFGADRPGLVEATAARVASHGGNWLESRLLHLGGHFTGIVRIEVESSRAAELADALRSPGPSGLTIVVHEARADWAARPGTQAPATIEVVGHDRPGIVRAISHALAARNVNVEELSTERTSAPMSGEPIFQARATVTFPAGLDAATLRADLEKIAADLMVDVRFSAKK